jgi:hypothetical protein
MFQISGHLDIQSLGVAGKLKSIIDKPLMFSQSCSFVAVLIGILGTRMFTTSALKEYKYSPDILGYWR